MTNKQLNGEHSMNFEQEEAKAGFIVEVAMAMHAEAVAAGDVEESSDPLESFRCGVKEGIAAMILIREEHEIKTEAEAVRAANN